MIRQRMIAGLVAATALVGLTACGSDSESSSTTDKATTTSAATATTKAAPATTAAGSATTSKSGSASTLPGGITIPDISIPQLTGDCAELQEGMPDLSNPSAVNQDDLDAYYDKLKSAVPSDLKDDVETVAVRAPAVLRRALPGRTAT